MTAVLLAASLASSPAFAHVPIPPRDPSEIGRREVKIAVENFTLVDQEGKLFHFAGSRGKVVLVTFIFTTCPDVCPLLTAKFAAIRRALAEKKTDDYLLLSITTDPERDSAKVLKEYAGRFKADFRNWAFLTGRRQDLARVWKIFGVNVTRTEAGDVNHTSLTTLIDRQGNRRVNYYGEKWHEKDVLKDIQRLRAQK
jgi:protein SCO1